MKRVFPLDSTGSFSFLSTRVHLYVFNTFFLPFFRYIKKAETLISKTIKVWDTLMFCVLRVVVLFMSAPIAGSVVAIKNTLDFCENFCARFLPFLHSHNVHLYCSFLEIGRVDLIQISRHSWKMLQVDSLEFQFLFSLDWIEVYEGFSFIFMIWSEMQSFLPSTDEFSCYFSF